MPSFTSTRPELTSTVQEFINADNGADEITYHNFSLLEQRISDDDTIQFAYSNILDDYMQELKEICVTVTLTDAEKLKYHYNPELLSYDLYGTTNLDFVIMKLNGVIDPKDFDLSRLTVVANRNAMSEFLSEIFSAEESYIQSNRDNENIQTD